MNLTLRPDTIDVWCARLQQPAALVRRQLGVLDEDELRRAGRFRSALDQRRFVVAHAVLRTLLGGYAGIDPRCVRFRTGAGGKPVLAELQERNTLCFNMSHGDELALYAFVRGREIGVDVEALRPIPDADLVAKSFFSAREKAALRALPEQQKAEGFLACWTRKEAYLKAVGVGLAAGLDQFDVSLVPGEPARLLRVQNDPAETARWSLCDLRPMPGYIGALAVEGHGRKIRCQRWRDEVYGNAASLAISNA